MEESIPRSLSAGCNLSKYREERLESGPTHSLHRCRNVAPLVGDVVIPSSGYLQRRRDGARAAPVSPLSHYESQSWRRAREAVCVGGPPAFLIAIRCTSESFMSQK